MKKRRDDGADKNPPGRPKVLPPHLDKRHQLRCSSSEFEEWVEESSKQGFPNVSAWIRRAANAALPKRARRGGGGRGG